MEKTSRHYSEELYCVCRKPYNPAFFYICCDICEGWFHGKCVGLTDWEGELVSEYVCAECEGATGHKTVWRAPSVDVPPP